MAMSLLDLYNKNPQNYRTDKNTTHCSFIYQMTHNLYLNGKLKYQTKYLYNVSLIIVNQYLKSYY